jgi:hypothetical protein
MAKTFWTIARSKSLMTWDRVAGAPLHALRLDAPIGPVRSSGHPRAADVIAVDFGAGTLALAGPLMERALRVPARARRVLLGPASPDREHQLLGESTHRDLAPVVAAEHAGAMFDDRLKVDHGPGQVAAEAVHVADHEHVEVTLLLPHGFHERRESGAVDELLARHVHVLLDAKNLDIPLRRSAR